MPESNAIVDIESVRREFPALQQYVWFQNGGVSITPRRVADHHARLMDELTERGPMHIVYPDEEYPRRTRSLATLAKYFSVSPSDMALMRGVSEGYQTVLRGLTWKDGDEIILSEDEEAALLLPTLHLRDLYNIKVVKLPVIADPGSQLAALETCLTSRTRLIALSHVTTDLGCRLPVESMCRLARERGVLSFIDLAHSAGVFPIDVAKSDCDFAGILSYKWMYSPYAAGLLYIRSESRKQLAVRYAGGRSEAWLNFEEDRNGLRETAERFQYGPWAWPLVHAWAEAAQWLSEIGGDSIAERTRTLTNRLKEALSLLPEITLLTHRAWEQSAALVTFEVHGWTGEALAAALRKRWNMIVKPLPHTREGLRISVPFFTLEEEIDRLVDALGILVRPKNGPSP